VFRIISLEYNADSLSRTCRYRPPAVRPTSGRVGALQGPPVETIRLEADVDVAWQLELTAHNPNAE